MPSFTVTSEPVEGETYHNEKAKSDLVVWRFELDEQGTVQLHKKPGNNPPGKGTVVNGDLKDAGRGEKRLYLDKPNPNGGGGRRQSDPGERRSIERQVSAKIASASLFTVERDADRQDVEDWGKKLRWLTDEVHAAIRGEFDGA